jgi:hypothetical protein
MTGDPRHRHPSARTTPDPLAKVAVNLGDWTAEAPSEPARLARVALARRIIGELEGFLERERTVLTAAHEIVDWVLADDDCPPKGIERPLRIVPKVTFEPGWQDAP